MANQVHLISAASLLNEDYRRELRSTGRLRPMANKGDILWQQLTLENFYNLVSTSKLYFRAHGEYTAYDEMNFRDFMNPLKRMSTCEMTEKAKKQLERRIERTYDILEKELYISCWYSSPDLSDVVFKAYAQEGSGVAIGTTVGSLIAQLNKHFSIEKNTDLMEDVFCANVQYIPQRDMNKEEIFEPAQIYAPVFVKGLQFNMDQEFRVCLKIKNPEELKYNSKRNRRARESRIKRAAETIVCKSSANENCHAIVKEIVSQMQKVGRNRIASTNVLIDIDLASLIQFIAIKDDGIFHHSTFLNCNSTRLIQLFEQLFGVQMEEQPVPAENGFLIYNVTGIQERSKDKP